MGGKRSYILSEPTVPYEFYHNTTGHCFNPSAIQFIKLVGSNLYYNKFHNKFTTLNMGDLFTLKEAREIQKKISHQTELTTLQKISTKHGPPPLI